MPDDGEDIGYGSVRDAARRCIEACRTFGVRLSGPEDPAAVAFVSRAVRRHLGAAAESIDPAVTDRAIRDALRDRGPGR